MKTLRQRIRKDKINCIPWKRYRYEIERLPISGQCLFARGGIPLDVLEMELRVEGWIQESEDLLELLSSNESLMRRHLSEIEIGVAENPFDDTWSEDDYKNFYKNL